MIEEVFACHRARIATVALVTPEEKRAERALLRTALQREGLTLIWSLSGSDGNPGWYLNGYPEILDKEVFSEFKAPIVELLQDESAPIIHAAIHKLIATARVIYDSNPLLTAPLFAVIKDIGGDVINGSIHLIRSLKDAAEELRPTRCTIVCLTEHEKIPIELRNSMRTIFSGLPKKQVIERHLANMLKKHEVTVDETKAEELVDACCGLSLEQASNILAMSLSRYNKETDSHNEVDIAFISKKKAEVLSSIRGLKYEEPQLSMEDVGGFENLKEWVENRKEGFTQKAKDFGLRPPRGVLCLGIPGTGKSLFSKAVASVFHAPLISLRLQDLKEGLVGATESNIRTALDAIESLGKCVVRIDEIEKSITGKTGQNLDGGTSDAILGSVLCWLQDRSPGAFVIATANDISALPPELLRKGRWDEIFFVNLPTEEERTEIFKIHLERVSRTLSDKSLRKLAKSSEGYSGAEIEAAVLEGLWTAFGDNKRDITVDDVLSALTVQVPLSKTMEIQVKALQEWAKNRARSVSKVGKKSSMLSLGLPEGDKVLPTRRTRHIVLDDEGVEDE